MKILYLSKSIIPSRSANSVHVMKMCQAFSDNGHSVILLAPKSKDKYEKGVDDIYEYYGVKKNFKIKKLWHPNIKGGALLYLFGILFYLIINRGFDLIYGRFLHGCFLATLLRKNTIFETHEILFKKKNHRYFFFNLLAKSNHLKKLIVISQALKNIYLKQKCLNDSMIQVAHDGADKVENFNSKIKLSGTNSKLKVGYVGHLYKGRGVEIILECAKQLSDMTFHIVGGLEEDIKYWKDFLKKMNISNVYFYGFVTPKETLNYRNSFDILIAPYSSKVTLKGIGDTSKFMSPLKIFEYMSHKKPIIASDLPVIREILNEKNSILVEHDNINLWINSLKKLRDIELRENIANQALIDFSNYTWKNRAFLVT
jgi:glycosyltransferase involved in cell wall biosynthesis